MSRGSFAESDAKLFISKLLTTTGQDFEPEDVQSVLANLVTEVRSKIAEFDYSIRIAIDQMTQERTYCFINISSDPATQLATLYGPDELSFIRRLLDAIFAKYNSPRMEVMAVTKEQCLPLGRPAGSRPTGATQNDDVSASQAVDRGISHSDVNRIMQELVDANWLAHSTAGFYSLSTRGLAELQSWLEDTFNDSEQEQGIWQRIKACMACREILTQGVRCANLDCLVRFHERCATTFFGSRRTHECPTCNTKWTGSHYVGEKAITQGRLYQQQQQQRNGRGRRSNIVEDVFQQQNGAPNDDVIEEELEEAEEVDEMEE
ncbi:hypothetical protein HOO65_080202 [Ceratocystis lukuohia]|uniref:Non-structural maintenance of chromosomes element 1 homolog n=1 Tax=Ceratocystis lukuohia TaxID=2019550 RepID=A0ABR4MAF4_9PEZI